MTAGRKLLESEQMDCRGAGLVQTTSRVLTAVVAPMAPMASMVLASVASMAPMAWMDLMAPELSVGILQWSLQLAATPWENDGSRSLRRVVRIGGMRAEGSCKIGGERVDGLPHKIAGKIDAGEIEEELARNELMGSAENGMSERRITAPWCGSRVAGCRVAAGKTTVLTDVTTSLASEAS